jgi:hypothetical protein
MTMGTFTAPLSSILLDSLKLGGGGRGSACCTFTRREKQQPLLVQVAFKPVTISSSAPLQAIGYGGCCCFLVQKVRMYGALQVNAMSSSGTGRYGSGKPQPSLIHICRSLQHCFFEICVLNMGRPAGQALHEFVAAAVDAFMAGFTFDKLSLQLAYGGEGMEEFKMDTAGYRLTSSEEHYRTQWLTTIYVTLQFLRVVDNEASRSAVTDDIHLVQVIHRVLEGQRHGEEQSQVKFDRGLATKGASGGAVAEKIVIAPQWVPVTQLVLLTLKVRFLTFSDLILHQSELVI